MNINRENQIHRSIRKLGGEGQLTVDDIQDFTASVQRIFCTMADGDWYTATQIEEAAAPEGEPRMRSGLRRMRELRNLEGVSVEERRPDEGREWEYRLALEETGQRSLFEGAKA